MNKVLMILVLLISIGCTRKEGCFKSGDLDPYGTLVFSTNGDFYRIQYDRFGDNSRMVYADPSKAFMLYSYNDGSKYSCKVIKGVHPIYIGKYKEMGILENIQRVIENE